MSCDFGFVKLNLNIFLLSDVSGQIIPPIPKKKNYMKKIVYVFYAEI